MKEISEIYNKKRTTSLKCANGDLITGTQAKGRIWNEYASELYIDQRSNQMADQLSDEIRAAHYP